MPPILPALPALLLVLRALLLLPIADEDGIGKLDVAGFGIPAPDDRLNGFDGTGAFKLGLLRAAARDAEPPPSWGLGDVKLWGATPSRDMAAVRLIDTPPLLDGAAGVRGFVSPMG
jgi:hypothetical protein